MRCCSIPGSLRRADFLSGQHSLMIPAGKAVIEPAHRENHWERRISPLQTALIEISTHHSYFHHYIDAWNSDVRSKKKKKNEQSDSIHHVKDQRKVTFTWRPSQRARQFFLSYNNITSIPPPHEIEILWGFIRRLIKKNSFFWKEGGGDFFHSFNSTKQIQITLQVHGKKIIVHIIWWKNEARKIREVDY